jgi:membrane-bound lytic murein transglycosylase A
LAGRLSVSFPEENRSGGISTQVSGGAGTGRDNIPGGKMPPSPPFRLTSIVFDHLPGWQTERHDEAFAAFRSACELGTAKQDAFTPACVAAQAVPAGDTVAARLFFEQHFAPFTVSDGQGNSEGLFTGYYEPEFPARLKPGGKFQTPLLSRPDDLVSVELSLFDGTFARQTFFGRVQEGRLVPYFTRREIAEGAISDRTSALAWLADPFDAFTLQVQGSGRLRLENDKVLRLGYDGKNGLPYRSIGAALIAAGEIPKERMSMSAIRSWLARHPEQADDLLASNPSYVFFRRLELDPDVGPPGALGVPLSSLRSLAIDTTLFELGFPVWLDTLVPAADNPNRMEPFRRLMFAQDTGSAIRGAVRGDIYFGSGDSAGRRAGHMKAQGRYFFLLPPELAARWQKQESESRSAQP